MKKRIWTAYYRNGILPPTNVSAGDETEAFSEAVATARFHMGMVDKWKPEDVVDRVELADPSNRPANWNSRPVSEFERRGIYD